MEKRTFVKLIAFAVASTALYPLSALARRNSRGHRPYHYGYGYGYGNYGFGYGNYGFGYGNYGYGSGGFSSYSGYGYGYGSYAYGYGYGLRKNLRRINPMQEDVYRPDGDPVAQ